jgi:predicted nucleotidyltransferase component of viral defense system
MDERFHLKYRRLLEILPDVAECANGRLVLVGGTALAVFHLEHRISVDLDFVPLDGKGDDVALKEALKGCLTRKGYRTGRAAYPNQFVVQFEDTSIKMEIFVPRRKVERFGEHAFGNAKLPVASVEEILEMKKESYADRIEARDLFDIVFILKERNAGFGIVRELLARCGLPKNAEGLRDIALSDADYEFFKKVVSNASKAGRNP